MYTSKQIEQYASVLAFASTPELFSLLTKQDKPLANSITKFHIAVTVLTAINNLNKTGMKISMLSLRDYMHEVLFKKTTHIAELEKRLEQYIPAMIKDKLITDKFVVTELGDQALLAKTEAFYAAELFSTTLQ